MLKASKNALDLIAKLKALYPNFIIYLSGGCCDGSALMVYDDFKLGENDYKLGEIENIGIFVHIKHYKAYLEGKNLELDATRGRGSEFSLDYELNEHFLLHSELCEI
ncbi:DUF779 domain-containing protein [Campylobacter sp. MIT 12-8780]|uniref:DUF779 domain-containing protein n=1 Tax=unclassified Campylobacter TaxID=2593542 RepID=UPI00115CDF08|nr:MULTISPECIES: DUF779 domain-containing protein [unclassified Campylobacter]NDJ27148.1 DUF779 domain-containing protein [Campylobacter sp. MIT 19-121]TQR41557.1 DUF779 domain-containing protein [Campylobacter sp. MIT 12-8780]